MPPFPKTLTISFVIITLLANAGTIGGLAGGDMTNKEKLMTAAVMGLRTPDRVDDFMAESIDHAFNTDGPVAGNGENQPGENEPTSGDMTENMAKKYAYAIIFLAALALVAIFEFMHKIINFFIGLLVAPSSDERGGLITLLLTLGLFAFLTGLSFLWSGLEVFGITVPGWINNIPNMVGL